MSSEDLKSPESPTERVSYSYGLEIARQLTDRGVEVDFDQFAAGFRAILEDRKPALSEAEVAKAFEMNERILAEKRAEGADRVNLDAGKKFLEENLKKEGVMSTASGLQYEVITEGKGTSPSASDMVEVHYHGTLIDGKVFDSSVERGTPTSFPLDRVIPGWTEGLQLMKEGAKYRFFIPYYLAYGERGAGSDIKPYSALTFEVELLKVGE
ncbi:MAG: FKBP-type peptidyl-prolyl cis-trans isomerase [Verrucomicrobiota bacterium]